MGLSATGEVSSKGRCMFSCLVSKTPIGAGNSSAQLGALTSASADKPFYWPGPKRPRLTPALARLIQEQRSLEVLLSALSEANNPEDLFMSRLSEQLSQIRHT
jgi:hypothetical protein